MAKQIRVELGESEVCDLGLSGVEEDVGGFEVAVGDVHLAEVPESAVDVGDEFLEFLFGEAAAGEALLEVAVGAEVGDDVAVAFGEERLVELEDVGVVHALQDADLLEDEFLQPAGLQRVQRDDLDGHGGVCVPAGVLVFWFTPRYTRAKFPRPIRSL